MAHPGWGIVEDRAGRVFFTDTQQVWQVSRDDRLSVAVPRVHTHELALDEAGNLLGEHLWYEGDASGKWGHRIWVRKPDGEVRDLVPARAGFREDYGFVRDSAGNQYWAARGTQTVIMRRSAAGAVTTHSTGPFQSLERMTVLADGGLAVMDAGSLRIVSAQGAVQTLVPVLSGSNAQKREVAALNYHMGLWADRSGNVFVAASSERSVLRVTRAGQVAVADRSPAPWAPSGGLVDARGRMWVMEFDPRNQTRVRRIETDGTMRIFAPAPGR